MKAEDGPWQSSDWIAHTKVLLDSYEHWLGSPLIERGTQSQDAVALFHAPFVVVSHGTEDDPLLNYGNQAALDLWQMSLSDFLGTPSRKTAEPVHRAERSQLLQRTQQHGYIDDYSGVRIASTGGRFRIHQAIVWNLLDEQHQHIGQAATFSKWTMLESASDAPP
jgi:hypothetical protein